MEHVWIDLQPEVKHPAAAGGGRFMAIFFDIVRNGSDYSCRPDGGSVFFVGRRVSYEGNIGLYNIFGGSRIEKLNYRAADFEAQHGFWSMFIEPTAACEGRNFLTLNTYDRAAFTFGFAQFAAHVADGDFVQYFRTMLEMPEAPDYFPHLGVRNGRICVTDTATPKPLENEDSTKLLMRYLNPGLTEVEDAEVICAAKLIHWTSRSMAARVAQVDRMVAVYRSFMTRADTRVGIDGRSADLCCVIADIVHQGRGGDGTTWPRIDHALKSSKPYDNLLAIGAEKYRERIRTLRKAIADNPLLKQRRWSSAQADFV